MEDERIKKIKTAIFDADEMYSRRLMNYLNSRYSDQLEAAAFTKKEALLEQLSIGVYDCVVSAEPVGDGLVPVIDLREMDETGNCYRYGSAKEIARCILKTFSSEVEMPKKEGELIGVYAPAGGSFRTRYAWELAKQHKGICIGMEEFCGVHTEQYWMEQLLFAIRERDEQVVAHMMDVLEWQDGIRILPSARCYLDYRYLQYEDYAWFFGKLKEQCRENVICDIGTGCFTELRTFALFDRIFVLKGKDSVSSRRLALFLQLAGQEDGEITKKLSIIAEDEEVAP